MSSTEIQPAFCILHVEDNRYDRELVAETLRSDGLICEFTYAVNEREFREALQRVEFDLILSDFSMPAFSGTAALAIAKEMRPEIPFIYVSGTIGEERAVESLKAGATDYVLKHHLARLNGVIRRALREARDRAERIRARDQLSLFRSLMDQSNDVIEVVDPETGRFLDVNRKACLTLGYTREEYMNLRLPDIAPALAGRPWEEVREGLRRSGSRLLESERRRKDGSVFPIEVSITYVQLDRDYLLAVVRDITDRKKAEQDLRASEVRLRELAETIEDAFWITNPSKNEMLYVSPAYEQIWGRTCQSLQENPRSWLDSIHEEDRERVEAAAMKQQSGDAYEEEYRIIRPDGEERWIRDSGFPVRNTAGQIERVVGVARDVTARRRLEEQLLHAQKMEGIGQLAGGVAHDFNNLLLVITMNSELAAMMEEVPAQIKENLQQIQAAADRASSLTRQLLMFSRRQVMQQRELDLNDIVTSLAKMLQRIIGEDVRLQLHLHPGPLVTCADAGMLDQVILNLAVNARDAMPEGGQVLIETSKQTTDEGCAKLDPDSAPGSYVCLSVKDTGTGIPPEVLPRIFEPFFTTKEAGKGTGLGLATVYGIVKQHRGAIGVQSQAGQGTRFQILLPASDVSSTQTGLKKARTRLPGGTETILLVEDDQAVRMITRALLERHGYHVIEAEDAVEAAKIWETTGRHVPLLLTDMVMPGGVNGLQLAESLRKENPRLKVIFASGYSAELAGSRLELGGADRFLQKPFTPDQLLGTVRQLLDS